MTNMNDRARCLMIARRRVGLGRFRKGCRKTAFFGRNVKAWRVPGTLEHGRDAMLCGMANAEAERLMRGEPGIFGV